jgi:thiamine-phosphate pyrophosphorylase
MLGTHHSLHRFEGARLYVLIDVERSADVFGRKVDALVAAGVDFLQLRDKSADDRTLLERAGRLRDATRGTPTRFIMNDRPDLAVLADADGVHLGQEELSVHQARQLIGPRRLIGYSTHSLDQATQAVLDGADYIGVGPTFRSTTKSFETFPGLDLLAQVARAIRLPAFAIGGIDTDRLDAVLETGIHGVAVASAIWSADDVEQAAKAFLSRLRRPSRNSDLPAGEA